MRLLKKQTFHADNQLSSAERMVQVDFQVHKFSVRPKPTEKRNIAIFSMFCEFGCEVVGVLYCLPQLLQSRYLGKYVIILGWHGRGYFYKHLADEFWEIKEEHQWLREYARAFHHESINLKQIERKVSEMGILVDADKISNSAIYPTLEKCPQCAGHTKVFDDRQICEKCLVGFPPPGFFENIQQSKVKARWLPSPSVQATEKAKKYIKGKSVGITARQRKTYGRNLPAIFYQRLIYLIEDMGYYPVWMGEKVSTLPCPCSRITDFSSTEDAKDLETTLALVSQLEFTIQFWTASSRLAGLTGVPYIIFESPDQIWGNGQEGIRLNLCSQGPRKLVVSHYQDCFEDHSATLDLAKQAIIEIEEQNYEDIIGLVGNKKVVELMRILNKERIGD